ncbi:MAG: hypothetical protein Kow00117_13730 [Phototrophicales bacterium]
MPERFNDEFWSYLDQLVEKSQIVIDNPKGSAHPDDDTEIYPLDYGYLAGTTSSDGAGIDVWIGEQVDRRVVAIVCTVDLIKRDTEIKILLGCTEQNMQQVVEFLNKDPGMRSFFVRRE